MSRTGTFALVASLVFVFVCATPVICLAGWYQTAYQKGFKKGLQDGYNDGYTDQYKASFNDAFQEELTRSYKFGPGPTVTQIAKAWKAGYQDGYMAGYTKGVKIARKEGETAGGVAAEDFKRKLRDSLNEEMRREHGLDE